MAVPMAAPASTPTGPNCAPHQANGIVPKVARAQLKPVDQSGLPRLAVRTVTVSPEVTGYIVDIARATRQSPSLSLGASPRGATALMATSRVWAWLSKRDFVTPDDVKALAHATLAHRLALRPEAELEGVSVGSVLASALSSVPVPR